MAGTKQPTDRSHFILPDLGEGVHEAELIKWRVKPGETVEEHQTLAEMETDKALVEVPSPWAGTIKELKGNEGDIINVGSVLVTYDVAGGGSAPKDEPTKEVRAQSAKQARPPMEDADDEESAGSEEREDAGTVVGNMGAEMTISERFARRQDSSNGQQAAGKALATPAVRRIARELGVDINRVPGTGRGGRVTASDVEEFAGGGAQSRQTGTQRSAAPDRAAAPLPQVDSEGVSERIPFRGVRRKIAQALHFSVQTTVHFTVVDEVDVTALERKRKEYSHVLGRKLSLLPFIVMATCRALRKHPAINANVDDANEEILLKGVINLGIAVDTDHGLMVPVIRDADQQSLGELADGVASLAKGCRERSIPREQMTGGTFTISNVGSYGGMFATPIINYPEVGILAAGRAFDRVLTKDGAFYAGKVLPLSLSCDHRVVDGAEGARFLNSVKKLLENPEALIQN
ncbi:MAG: 2-oxo acid dehydrogenase subunit E2 [Phycisphaerales bacterium]|nr:MAG: 2-oxo acid dehydrogenase subunit E2 [Phycisphaerales bacterium]